MLKTNNNLSNLYPVSAQPYRGYTRDPIVYHSESPGGTETHVHFNMPRQEARILYGRLPLNVRTKIRMMQSVSFEPDVKRETDWRNSGIVAFFYYDDSPCYNSAVIYGHHAGDVEDEAQCYYSQMQHEIEGTTHSACTVRQIKTAADFDSCMNDACEIIQVEE